MTLASGDHRINLEQGVLFARAWIPSDLPRDSKVAILLFHDSLGCVALWRDFPERLATATRLPVVAYDRLGFGLSDAHSGPLPLTFVRDEAVTVVPRLCEALGIEVMVPFGHSIGGAMAIATAAHLPERCAAVIAESAQSFVEDSTLSGVRAAKTDFERPGKLERLARYHGVKAHWVLDAWIQTWLAPGFAGWRLDDDLKGLHCPMLAIRGDRDEYGSLEHLERITRLVQGPSRAVVLDGCGHLPHREQPTRVLREVTMFLARYDATLA